MGDDVPLPRAGILRLVDQHMVDAAIELVVHPLGGDAVEHRQRPVDQVVIVEQAAFQLLAPVVRGRRGGDMQQRFGAIAGGDGAAAFDQGADTQRFGFEQLTDDWIGVNELFGHDRFARRPVGFGEEHAEIFVDLSRTGEHQRFA